MTFFIPISAVEIIPHRTVFIRILPRISRAENTQWSPGNKPSRATLSTIIPGLDPGIQQIMTDERSVCAATRTNRTATKLYFTLASGQNPLTHLSNPRIFAKDIPLAPGGLILSPIRFARTKSTANDA
jgi:hypothetical protein